MKKSNKAVLLSALVFPGAGHFLLKKHISGAILATASLAALYLIISNMLERAQQIADKILSGEVNLDEAAIAELLSRQPSGGESWLTGIVDSYRCGRAQDKNDIGR
jgi:hypothetical protein